MAEKREIKVGIIAAPERPAELSAHMIEQLAKAFSNHVDDAVDWTVERRVDPLTGAAETAQDILYNAKHIKEDKAWDYAICLTDLPIFYNKDIIAADMSFNYQVAQISLPAFGWAPKQKRIKQAVVRLLAELYERTNSRHLQDDQTVETGTRRTKSMARNLKLPVPSKMMHRQESHTESDTYSNEPNGRAIDIRFTVHPRFLGRIILLLGMTFANNPFRIMTSFKSIIAIAFTTGAFALIFPTIWNLGQTFSVYRLTGMMVAAILGFIGWIIVAHNLWEYPSKRNKPNIRRLYNLTTAATLLVDVVTYYTFMFVLFLVACLIFIPVDYFQSMIHDYGDVGSTFVNYMRVAWATASISTIVSAIGAGLENEEHVRNITYGYRQSRRYEAMNQKKNSHT